MQLDYSEAHKHLLQSARKAPQNSAAGFKQHVAKLSVTVDLLLGNIPERQTFLAKEVILLFNTGDLTGFSFSNFVCVPG